MAFLTDFEAIHHRKICDNMAAIHSVNEGMDWYNGKDLMEHFTDLIAVELCLFNS